VTRLNDRTRDFLKVHKASKGYVAPMNGKDGKEFDWRISERQRGTWKWGKKSPDSFCERPATREEVKEWAAAEGVGIAAITGERSGLVALDVDFPKKELVEMLLCGVAPDTPAAKSPGGGGSFLFRFSPGLKNMNVACPLFNDKDSPCYIGKRELASLRADGQLIVLPPGPGREWLPGYSPDEVQPAEVPDGLIDILERIPKGRECSSTVSAVRRREEQDTVLKYSPSLNLDEVLSSDAFILHVARFLDLPIIMPEDKFICPYHPDETVPSANFFKGRAGGYLLRCWHSPVTVRLGDFYHFRITGSEKRLRNSSSATWLCRLLLDSSFIKPPPVKAAALSTDEGHIQAFYHGCVLLHQCRLLYDSSNKTFPAARSFMPEWCGIPDSEYLNALRWLTRHGFLVVVERGQLQTSGYRTATLYRVCDNGGDQ
jgi:hypothetical protein